MYPFCDSHSKGYKKLEYPGLVKNGNESIAEAESCFELTAGSSDGIR